MIEIAGRLLLSGLLGAVAGSFVATLAGRWPEGRSVAAGRSRCDGCGRRLAAHELVPVLGFVVRRGRCGSCGTAIARRHLLIELAGIAIGLSAAATHGLPAAAVGMVVGWTLLGLAWLDAEHLWLPDRLTLPLLGFALVASACGVGPALRDAIAGAALGWGLLAGLAWLYRRLRGRIGVGGGDPKLLAAIGAWLGWQALPVVLLAASLLGLAVAALSALRGKAVTWASALPLGTLLAVAAWALWLGTGA